MLFPPSVDNVSQGGVTEVLHHSSITTHRGNSSEKTLNAPWTDCSNNPFQLWSARSIKTNPASSHFKHNIIKKSSWICGFFNPCWVHEEVNVRALVAEMTRKAKALYHGAQREEQGSVDEEEGVVVVDGKSYLNSHNYALVASLKACAKQKDLLRGSRIHADIVERGLFENNLFVGSALVNMYTKCGALEKAQDVFDKLPVRNEVSWTALITGYAQHGLGEEALKLFEKMQQEGFSPNAVTFVCALKACGSKGAANKGQDLHTQIVKEHLLESNVIVGNALVDMYVKCGLLGKAQGVFDELPVKNVVSWTTLIAGYTQHGHSKEALDCFELMQLRGFSPNGVTSSCILKACGDTRALSKGQEIHAKIVRDGLHEKDFVVATALIDMYAKCGLLGKAREMFDLLSVRNVVSWTALIAGYTQHEFGEEALNCFEEMQLEGFSPDGVTFACVLKACGSVGAAHKGQEIHYEIVRDGMLEKDVVVGTALVDMYANCGMLAEARQVSGMLPIWDLVLWNTLLEGYAQLGKDKVVFNLFNKMIRECMEPNTITFTIILNTCSHEGLLDKGQLYFETISKGYGMMPNLEHHSCIIDLFGRAGRLDKAVRVVEEMSFPADFALWHTLLGACQKWGNTELGTWAFKHAACLNDKDAAAYVSLSSLYLG